MTKSIKLLLASAASCAFLAACGGGGGGGGSSTPTPTPPTSSAPVFEAGKFDPASDFDHLCETPRSGVDPLSDSGASYRDRTGSTLEEKFWIRSWSNETYLWNTEIADRDPNSIADRVAYFDVMKSNELSETGSGKEKDDFHFSESTEDYVDRRNSTATSGYGLRLTSVGPRDANGNSIPPRDFRILYSEPDSPASAVQDGQVNFPRGTKILKVDGADLVSGNDTATLNAGLFPAVAGEEHTFEVEDVDGTVRTFSITSQDVAQSPVNRTEIIETDTGKVGYVLFNTFSPFESERSLNEAFTQLEDEEIDDLVLDLRYNGGGLIAVAAQLGYMIAGEDRTEGKTASLLQYNEAAGNTNPTTGELVRPIPFLSEAVGWTETTLPVGTPLSTVDLPRVYILTTGGTCSASELVINSLLGIDYEVIVIGDTTCGKPYGFLPTDNCGQTYYTIQFKSVNDKGFGDYSDGFSPADSTNTASVKAPGCTVADDITKELGDPDEALLSAALFYRDTGTCSTTAVTKSYTRPEAKTYTAVDGYALDAVGDPFETTADSYLDSTMPGDK